MAQEEFPMFQGKKIRTGFSSFCLSTYGTKEK